MKARWGSHSEVAAGAGASSEAGGRGGAVWLARGTTRSVATPGQFESSGDGGGGSPWASKRLAQARMVWREMPVRRSISRWVLPARRSVQIVVCRCGFKTFTS